MTSLRKILIHINGDVLNLFVPIKCTVLELKEILMEYQYFNYYTKSEISIIDISSGISLFDFCKIKKYNELKAIKINVDFSSDDDI
jgi:hypothetical protein